MKVSSVESYINNVYTQGLNTNRVNGGIAKAKQTEKTSETQTQQADSGKTKDLISQQEREFFKSMFPESSEQIDKHVIFNRNGKVSTPNLSKGSIVDGRI